MSVATRASCDVVVVGAGMAGMSAALFAAGRGLSCIQVGRAGGLLFASGLLDLMAVHPPATGRMWRRPFDALAALAHDAPGHPLARVDPASIRAAFAAVTAALEGAGLPYAPPGLTNSRVLTSIGTTKPTYAVPRSMVAGVAALEARPPCLLVEFRGLREFSAAQIAAALHGRWPGLRHHCVEFPGMETVPELVAAHVARALETDDLRERTIARLKPLLGDAQVVGFPALLGLTRSVQVHAAFEAALGVPVFEIPTMPTSVPGLRLHAALESAVAGRGVQRHPHATVHALAFDHARNVAILDLADVAGGSGSARVEARAVVLATGRFSGRGLVAGRDGVREPILGLPVEQPDAREGWHRPAFLDRAGHPLNRAGIRVDRAWRPLGRDGTAASPRLFAAGSILAGHDWSREKCGSGLAIATAWGAVEALTAQLRPGAG